MCVTSANSVRPRNSNANASQGSLGHFAAILARGDFRSIHPPAGEFVCPAHSSVSPSYSSQPIYLWRFYNYSMTAHLIEDWTPRLAHRVGDWQRISYRSDYLLGISHCEIVSVAGSPLFDVPASTESQERASARRAGRHRRKVRRQRCLNLGSIVGSKPYLDRGQSAGVEGKRTKRVATSPTSPPYGITHHSYMLRRSRRYVPVRFIPAWLVLGVAGRLQQSKARCLYAGCLWFRQLRVWLGIDLQLHRRPAPM